MIIFIQSVDLLSIWNNDEHVSERVSIRYEKLVQEGAFTTVSAMIERSNGLVSANYLIVREGREKVEPEQREDGDHQEKDHNDVHDRPKRLQCVSQSSVSE